MESQESVPGRAMDALDSCPRGGDEGVCVFGGSSTHAGTRSPSEAFKVLIE